MVFLKKFFLSRSALSRAIFSQCYGLVIGMILWGYLSAKGNADVLFKNGVLEASIDKKHPTRLMKGPHMPCYSSINKAIFTIYQEDNSPSILESYLDELTSLSSLTINIAKSILPLSPLRAGFFQELARVLSTKLSGKLSGCTYLFHLAVDFARHHMGDQKGWDIFLEGLAEFHHLRSLHLNLEGARISALGSKNLLHALSKLGQLISLSLNLDGNFIRNEGAQTLASTLRNFKHLLRMNLNLGSNDILGEGAVAIIKSLRGLSYLVHLNLNLSHNNLFSQGAKAFIAELGELKQLITLYVDLDINFIQADGLKCLGAALGELTQLRSLGLSMALNHMGVEGAQVLGGELAKLSALPCLEYLSLGLSGNILGAKGAHVVLIGLGSLTQLRSLHLKLGHNNIFYGEALFASSEKIWALSGFMAALIVFQHLKHLEINLWGDDMRWLGGEYLAMALEKLSHLESLSLRLTCSRSKYDHTPLVLTAENLEGFVKLLSDLRGLLAMPISPIPFSQNSLSTL